MVLHHGLNFQLAVRYVHLKGVTDDKYFDDFFPLKNVQKKKIYIYWPDLTHNNGQNISVKVIVLPVFQIY